MNWKVWTSLIAIVVVTAAFGVAFYATTPAEIVEPSWKNVTAIHVDLVLPHQGEVSVTYPAESAPAEDFMAVASARKAVQVLLPQYYTPYENPEDVRVRRRGGEVSMRFPIFARERLEFLFPKAALQGTWRPLWETLHFTVELPAGYEVVATEQEGLEDDMDVEAGGRWTVTGEERSAGWADFTVHYVRTEHVANGESGG